MSRNGRGLKRQTKGFVRASIGGEVVIPWQRIIKEVDDRSVEQIFMDQFMKGVREEAALLDEIIMESSHMEITQLVTWRPDALASVKVVGIGQGRSGRVPFNFDPIEAARESRLATTSNPKKIAKMIGVIEPE